MANDTNLKVDGLEYGDIRSNLEQYLKGAIDIFGLQFRIFWYIKFVRPVGVQHILQLFLHQYGIGRIFS